MSNIDAFLGQHSHTAIRPTDTLTVFVDVFLGFEQTAQQDTLSFDSGASALEIFGQLSFVILSRAANLDAEFRPADALSFRSYLDRALLALGPGILKGNGQISVSIQFLDPDRFLVSCTEF